MVKFVIPCLLFAAVPSFASQEQSMEQMPQSAPGSQGVSQPPGPQGTPGQTPGSPGQNQGQTPLGQQGQAFQQLLSSFLAQGKSPQEAMRLAQQQSQGQPQTPGQTLGQTPGQVLEQTQGSQESQGLTPEQSQRLSQALANGASPEEALRLARGEGQFDVNAAISNVVDNNKGKFDQGCIQTLMAEAKKRGAGSELAMVQQLLKKYPRQLSMIRSVALVNCSQGARNLCNNALLATEGRQSTQTNPGMMSQSSEGEERAGTTAGSGRGAVQGQSSASVNDARNQGVGNARDADSADSLSYTPSTARNQRAVMSQGENKINSEQPASR